MRRRYTLRESIEGWRQVVSLGEKAENAIWEFQEAISGPKELANSLSERDIEVLDEARVILSNIADEWYQWLKR